MEEDMAHVDNTQLFSEHLFDSAFINKDSDQNRAEHGKHIHMEGRFINCDYVFMQF
jgi:hypothetical protein